MPNFSYYHRRTAAGLCVQCGEHPPALTHTRCNNCRFRRAAYDTPGLTRDLWDRRQQARRKERAAHTQKERERLIARRAKLYEAIAQIDAGLRALEET